MNKPELISPAGTLEKLKIAFDFGADAVYAGLPEFSLRARINDFSYSNIKKGVEYAHKYGKKFYATLNIYPHNSHLRKAELAIKQYYEAGVDGLTVSDPGILSLAQKRYPRMEIHLSTQANCTNWQTAKFWRSQGVKRIILARELSLKEIQKIHKAVPEIKLECFVHGAMCVSYSGRCILSKLLSGRSANLGECSQPCRWKYKVTWQNNEENLDKLSQFYKKNKYLAADLKETEESGRELEVEEDRHGTYILNSKDLCLIEHLGELYKAGISAFKLEGRTKSPYYVGAITKLYRETIDNNFNPPQGWQEELEKFVNRGYTTGFLFSEEKCEHNFLQPHKKCDWQFAGQVIKSSDEKIYTKVHNSLFVGDEVEFICPGTQNFSLRIESLENAKNGKKIEGVHGGQGQIVVIRGDNIHCIPKNTLIRRKIKR